MGFLASFCYGASIIFPSDHFRADCVVNALMAEDATVLLGVPTMFISELEILAKTSQKPRCLRTGLASGSAVSQTLMNEIRVHMGVDKMLIAYGMTETSPVNFITSLDDPEDRRISTIGRVMPHTVAKVVNKQGKIVPRGQRGELCVGGYALQKGYWKNEEKTREVMKYDADGMRWMHTGDEVIMDEDGYGHVTGRIKDLIIRGEHANLGLLRRFTDNMTIYYQGEKTYFQGKSKTDWLRMNQSANVAWWASRTRGTAKLCVVS